MNCKNCGFQLNSDDQFCKNCGATVNAQQNMSNVNLNQGVGVTSNTPVSNPSAVVGPSVSPNPNPSTVANNASQISNNVMGPSAPNMNSVPVNVNTGMGQGTNLNAMPTSGVNQNNTVMTSNVPNINNNPVMPNNSSVSNNVNSASNFGVNQVQGNNKTKLAFVAVIVVLVLVIAFLAFMLLSDDKKDNSGSLVNNNNSSNSNSSNNDKSNEVEKYKVSYGGFILEIPTDYMYNNTVDGLVITDQDQTWLVQLVITEGSYDKLKANMSLLQSSLSENTGFEVTNAQIRTINGSEFITMEVPLESTVIGFTKINSMYSAMVYAMTSYGEVDYDVLSIGASIVGTAKLDSSTNNLKSVNIDIDQIKDIMK